MQGRCSKDTNQRSVTVTITDTCPECGSDHIDMQALTFNKVLQISETADTSTCVGMVSFQPLQCLASTPLSECFAGSHRLPCKLVMLSSERLLGLQRAEVTVLSCAMLCLHVDLCSCASVCWRPDRANGGRQNKHPVPTGGVHAPGAAECGHQLQLRARSMAAHRCVGEQRLHLFDSDTPACACQVSRPIQDRLEHAPAAWPAQLACIALIADVICSYVVEHGCSVVLLGMCLLPALLGAVHIEMCLCLPTTSEAQGYRMPALVKDRLPG